MGKLENKTKAQLIEIIMRKDDVENELRKQINDLTQEYDTLKADYEDACDAASTNDQDNYNKYQKLQGDYATLKSSYNHAIKDCQGTAKRLEDVSADLAKVQEKLADTKSQKDAWTVIAVISVIVTCVVLCLC